MDGIKVKFHIIQWQNSIVAVNSPKVFVCLITVFGKVTFIVLFFFHFHFQQSAKTYATQATFEVKVSIIIINVIK